MDFKFDLEELSVEDMLMLEESRITKMPITATVNVLSKYLVDEDNNKIEFGIAKSRFAKLKLSELNGITDSFKALMSDIALPK